MLQINRLDVLDDELPVVQALFTEYAVELGENLGFQSFDTELADPLKKYGPPGGSLFIAWYKGEVAGCVALQEIAEDTCEMKRLYVRPAFRKYGIGDALVQALLEDATAKGFRTMVLDTLERLQPAIRLYQRHGFTETSAYYDNPLPGVVYMRKELRY